MASRKRLRSVCHSIAHHSVSGLSFVHPHVLRACRAAGLKQMRIQLLDTEPCPEPFRPIEPLRLSLRSLREKLEHILASEGFALTDLRNAEVRFEADPTQCDDHCSICLASLAPLAGDPVQCKVDYLGNVLRTSALDRGINPTISPRLSNSTSGKRTHLDYRSGSEGRNAPAWCGADRPSAIRLTTTPPARDWTSRRCDLATGTWSGAARVGWHLPDRASGSDRMPERFGATLNCRRLSESATSMQSAPTPATRTIAPAYWFDLRLPLRPKPGSWP